MSSVNPTKEEIQEAVKDGVTEGVNASLGVGRWFVIKAQPLVDHVIAISVAILLVVGICYFAGVELAEGLKAGKDLVALGIFLHTGRATASQALVVTNKATAKTADWMAILAAALAGVGSGVALLFAPVPT